MTDIKDQDIFKGWAATGKDLPLVETELMLKTWDEDSVDLDVTHCGICGTDNHILKDRWSMGVSYPCCVGHEITGIVTRVGKNVTHLQVGDRAGAGAQAFSCQTCPNCVAGNENLCYKGLKMTMNNRWPNGDSTYGGFADRWRGDRRFIHNIPVNLSNKDACSFLCSGGAVYAALTRWNVGPGSVVGVLGMGGVGHFAVLFSKAMKCDKVIALSRGEKKHDVSMELGCDDYVNIDDADDMVRMKKTFTHIVCTGFSQDFKWEPFVISLKANGVFMSLGLPGYNLPPMNPILFGVCQVNFAGSMICSYAEMKDALEFASKHQIKPWITKYPMKEMNQALKDFEDGLPRFRFVLEN